jgi:acyl-coenzyme A thioesterase PaaI-like protein
VTDLSPIVSIPSRLGVTLHPGEDTLEARLAPAPTTCHHGRVRASAVVFLVDVVAGLQVDTDPDTWAFTSDLSLRLPDRPAPARLDARARLLRAGRRSTTSAVDLTVGDEVFGSSTLGFARVGRRDGDPAKPEIDLPSWAEAWAAIPVIDVPLRDAAGIEVVDPRAGSVALDLRPELLNPAGALQGAMVSLVAEAAAEDAASHRADAAQVVVDLDIRFLGQARQGPVVSRVEPAAGGRSDAWRVTLVDEGADRIVTDVLARTIDAT